METSDALDLEQGVFRARDPHRIALSLQRSAERSRRRKSEPYRSAMSMLTFYINRGGRNLSATQKRVLERAKTELRKLYGKEESRMPEKKTLRRAARDQRAGKSASTQAGEFVREEIQAKASPRRRRATREALEREGTASGSRTALSRQALTAARRRPASERSKSSPRGAT